jgi:hypothetical protein
LGGIALYAGGGSTGAGELVAEGTYDNKGQTAKWEIRNRDGVLVAYVQFPGNPMTEIASQGTLESLGQLIDSRMREQGYLPPVGTGVDNGSGGGSSFSTRPVRAGA